MHPANPSITKPPALSFHSNASGISNPQQPHLPSSEVIDREVAEVFSSQEAQRAISISIPLEMVNLSLTRFPQQPAFISLTEENSEAEISNIMFQDSLIAFLPSEPRFFIGRKEQLENLQRTLQAKGIVVVIPEENIPCQIGKTTLTSQYARGKSSVLWITARNKKALEASFAKLAKLFSIDPSKVKEYLAEQERLIIFDGAQDPELLKGYIPQGKCQVIVTSRKKEWPFPILKVGPFSVPEAVDFLCQATQKEDRIAAQRIAEELDCLPTSLEKAARAVVEHQAELAGYSGIKEGILDKNNQSLKERSNLGNRNHNFIGRESSLVVLEEALRTNFRAVISAKRRVAAEVGLGGIGKTQIALQYAFRNADKYPYLIWRINCESEATLQESYRVLAEKIGITLTEEEKKQGNALIKKVKLGLESKVGWLLIYDNAESQNDLEGFIPNHGGHILITSRSPEWNIGFAQVFKIGVFKRKESIALIHKITSLNIQDADQLAELVKDLPIAVSQAAAYIKQTSISYAEYERLFLEKSRRLLPAQQPTDEYTKTLDVTWQISMEKIQEKEKQQAEALSAPCIVKSLMNLCAFLGSSNIPKEQLLLPWVKSIYKRDQAALHDLDRSLLLLRDFSIIDHDGNSISVHALVQLVTRNEMSYENQLMIFKQALEILFIQIDCFDAKKTITWNGPNLCMSHAVILMERKNLFEKIDLKVQHKFILALGDVYSLTNIHQSLKVNSIGLQIARMWDKESTPNNENKIALASSLNNFGMNLRAVGRTKESLQYLQEALEIRKKLYDPLPHPDIALSLNNIADTFLELGKADEALKYFSESLEIRRKDKKNPNSLTYCAILNNIGGVYLSAGKADRALDHFQQAYDIVKNLPGEALHHVAICLNNIGIAFQRLNNNVKALKCFQKAFNIQQKLYSESPHPNVAKSLISIGGAFQALGKTNKALKYYLQALIMQRKYYGESPHSDIALNLKNIGDALLDLKHPDQALKNLQNALKILQQLYPGFLHPHIAFCLNSIGIAFLNLEKASDALNYFNQAYSIQFKIYGTSNHPDVASSLSNINMALKVLKKSN